MRPMGSKALLQGFSWWWWWSQGKRAVDEYVLNGLASFWTGGVVDL